MKPSPLTETLRETLALFEAGGAPMTTTEVTERVDVGRRSAYERLERLVDHGHLETKHVGGNGRVWWQPADDDSDPSTDQDSQDDQFQTLVDATDEYAIFRLGSEGCVQTWNSGAERIKGYDADEIIGKHFSTFYTDEDRAAGVPETNLEDATRHGSTEDDGWRVRADGSTFWANVTLTTIRDEDGELDGYAKVTRDMTDQREYERQLETQTERLKRQRDDLEHELDEVFDRISDGFYALDEELRFSYLNDRATDVLGVDDAAVGADIRTVVDLTDAFENALYEARDAQESVTLEDYYGPANRWFYNAIYPSESGLSVYFREITEQKRRERTLERRARQQQVVSELGQLALETADLDELMHEAVSQVATALETDYCKVLDLDDERDELLLRQGVGWMDGIVGEATVSANQMDSQAAYTLANDHPIVVEDLETESRFGGPDLLRDHDVSSGISVVIGSFDEPWGILGTHDTDARTFTAEDVTFVQSVANVLAEAIERHQYQRRLEGLVADLEESNERLEQFAYAASHDLQEPLRMVSSYLQLIDQRYEDVLDEDGQEFLAYAVDGAERMRSMIEGLLQYSRVETQGEELEPVELEAVLDDVCENLRLKIEDNDAEITVASLPRVLGDTEQLRQVFQNLLSNAIEYSGDAPPRVVVDAERNQGTWIISVTDEGIGIDHDDQERIFEVFQRLHSPGEHPGTGIGLALCQRIIERHGVRASDASSSSAGSRSESAAGEIWVESEPGEGATFSLTLLAA